MRLVKIFLACALALSFISSNAYAQRAEFYFSVLNQRSPALTAEYWNPILEYISKKSGVELKLKIAKTAQETTAITIRGEVQFAYTNQLFSPERLKLGWTVIARANSEGIRGQLVVAHDSPIRSLDDLQDLSVAFPSAESFVGYKVPMDALMRKHIKVLPSFAGNQEGVVGQLKAGKVAAAGMIESVIVAYGKRENFAYRVLWQSKKFPDLAIMSNQRLVPKHTISAVRRAFIGMASDAEGQKILERGAHLLKLEEMIGFVAANDKDYEAYRAFYRNTLLKE